MENPFEIIIEKLNAIEGAIKLLQIVDPVKVDNSTVNYAMVLNIEEAARYTNLSKSAIYKKTSQREIPHFKRGKKLYFKRTELDDWLTEHKITSKQEIERLANDYIVKKPKKGRKY